MAHIHYTHQERHDRGSCRRQYRIARIVALAAAIVLAPSAWAQVAPRLIGATPPTGAVDVPVTTTVVFEFDQPMDTSVSLIPTFELFGIKFFGNIEVVAGSDSPFFGSTWSGDGRTLTGSLLMTELPPGTLIEWTLNPSGGGDEPLVNEAGIPLGEVSGSFTTAGEAPGGGDEDCDGIPDDWGFYGIFKGVNYEQGSAADPVPAAERAYTFGALARGPEAGPDLTQGAITFPDGVTQDLNSRFGSLAFLSEVPSEALLESLFPPGTWTLRFTQTGEGERVIPMAMPANDVPIPKVANYVEAQRIVATQDFTLTWNSFNTAGPNGFLSLVVEEESFLGGVGVVFQAPDLCIPRELPVTATSVVIPANTLAPDQVYTATLTFSKAFYRSPDAVPEMAGSGTLVRSTTFTLNTGSGGTALPATLSAGPILPNGNPQIRIIGSVDQRYRVERSGTLINPIWINAGVVTMDAAGQGVFEDTSAGKVYPLFYRAVAD